MVELPNQGVFFGATVGRLNCTTFRPVLVHKKPRRSPLLTTGPRTRRKDSHGMRISAGFSFESEEETGGTKDAWYTTSPRLFCVRTVAFHVRRCGSSSDSNPHDMAMPSKALRSNGVLSTTVRAPRRRVRFIRAKQRICMHKHEERTHTHTHTHTGH